MNIAIDISNPFSKKLFDKLASANTAHRLIPFYCEKTPLMRVFKELRPEVFILNDRCNYIDASYIKSCQDITIIHLGNDSENILVADLVTGESSRYNCLGFNKFIDLELFRSSEFDKKYKSDYVCITSNLKNNNDQVPINIIEELVKLKTKFIGNTKIDVPNYLGRVDQEDLTKFCGSSKYCIDITGNDYLTYLASGSENILSAQYHFNSLETLRDAMSYEDIFETEDHRTWIKEKYEDIGRNSYSSLVHNLLEFIG
jgi:hypothetical protein